MTVMLSIINTVIKTRKISSIRLLKLWKATIIPNLFSLKNRKKKLKREAKKKSTLNEAYILTIAIEKRSKEKINTK